MASIRLDLSAFKRPRKIVSEYTCGFENPYIFLLKVPPHPFCAGNKAKALILYARETL